MNAFMREALLEAYKAYKKGEVPVGCIIEKDGEIIARAHNDVEHMGKATAHAEILALEQASEILGGWRLESCNLYVTLEPCMMCLGAIINARIKTIYIGARDKEKGAVLSKLPILQDDMIPCNARAVVYDDPVCSYILSRFFRELRRGRIPKAARGGKGEQ